MRRGPGGAPVSRDRGPPHAFPGPSTTMASHVHAPAGHLLDVAESNSPASTAHFAHRVQFYDHDTLLYDTVVAFFAEGLGKGESLVAITTETHRAGLVGGLRQASIDVDALCASRKLVLLDAQQTLS